jgi:hypothetical protein
MNSEFPVYQEPDVIPGGRLARIGVVAVLIGVVGVFFAGLVVVAGAGSLRPNVAGQNGIQPGPRAISRILQTPIWDSQEGLDRERRQRAELEQLGWANRAGGMARIPIEDAIDLVVEESQR